MERSCWDKVGGVDSPAGLLGQVSEVSRESTCGEANPSSCSFPTTSPCQGLTASVKAHHGRLISWPQLAHSPRSPTTATW